MAESDAAVAATSSKKMDEKKTKIVTQGLGILLCLGIIGGVVAFFLTRPKNLRQTRTDGNGYAIPSVIQYASISEFPGTVVVEETFLLKNTSSLRYQLTVVDAEYPVDDDEASTLSLYLTRTATQADLALETTENPFFIGELPQLVEEFPLADDFRPEDYQGVLIVDTETGATVGSAVFQETETHPVLTAEMSGGSYTVKGQISILHRNFLEDGVVRAKPVLLFQDIVAPSAPGPYLYISLEPQSRRLRSGDIFIPIDNTDKGAYTLEGTFDQPLDEITDALDYSNGSFVVWCRPFTVWLGGGQIEVLTQ